MQQRRLWSSFQQPAAILLGTAIYAFGLHFFVISNRLMEGGVTGLSLLLHYAAGTPLSLTTLLLNIPLFGLGWRMLGGKSMTYTVFGTLALSFFLWIMEVLIQEGWIVPFTTDDYLLAALYAGITLGGGLGLVFRFGGTTGGADILARLGNKLRGWSIGQFMLTFDALVIALSLFYIPVEKVLYTLVSVYLAAKTIDFIVEGEYAARAFTIITDSGKNMAKVINEEMDRGVTLIPAKGAYSDGPKEIVYCVVYIYEVRRLKEIARRIDPSAFIIVASVHEVVGEGFKTD